MEYVALNNGVKMPMLGYGTFLIGNEETEKLVGDALSVGYRSIDTAQAYYNEEGVGRGIKMSGVARGEIFLTTKVWIANAGEEKAAASIDESLKKLQTDYVDLLLIHQAFGDYYGTWRAMEKAYKAGKARAIGVSNFYEDRLLDLVSFNEIKPMVDQVETHIFSQRKNLRKYLDQFHVQHEAWAPFAQGKNGFFTNEVLTAIGDKYGKKAGQVGLRFLIQRGVVVIPKSSSRERMEENLNVFDFELSEEDMAAIDALDSGENLIMDHENSEMVQNFLSRFGLI